LQKQIPIFKSAFFDKILKGELNSVREIYEQSKLLNVSLDGQLFNISLLQLETSSQDLGQDTISMLNKKRLIIIDLFKSKTGSDRVYFHNIDHNKIALLIIHNMRDLLDFKIYISEYIDILNNTLNDNHYRNVIWSIGGIYESPIDISRSYAEAIELLNYKKIQRNDDILYYTDMPQTSEFYYFPDDIQRRLSNYTKSGESEYAKELLNEIYVENLFKRQISPFMASALINDLWCTLFRLLDQDPFDDPEFINKIQELAVQQEGMNLNDRFETCIDTYYNVIGKFHSHKNSHNTRLVEQILKFINENYHDMDLSLTLLADEFNISDVYLSTFFKEQTGENFYTYLQELRIQNAKDLLKQTDMPVAEIVSTIGYSSYNTFAKAFKRIVGMTATDYRTQQ
ncbi:MAG: helix-turn-helix transcriptional regulator, partial [Clostridiales bacterium]|nr:helix-turn-helix transcriptional regulator [Clostridiales bacterium]